MDKINLLSNDINLNLYKTFYNVAKYGNITKTAEVTFTSQPAISRSIKQLENLLGIQLFFRTLNGMELTEKGKELYNCLEDVYSKIIETENNLQELNYFDKGKLNIGIPSQIATFVLFNQISQFHKMYPNIEITIVSKTTTQLLQALNKREIDFIIDTAPINIKNDKYTAITLKEVNNCFVNTKTFNYKDLTSITSLKDLENFPLILPIKNTENRNNLDIVLKENNVKTLNVLNIHTSEMIIGAVKNGLGIGYVIEDLVKEDIEKGELQKINIKEKLPITKIELVYDTHHLNDISTYFIKNFLDIKI